MLRRQVSSPSLKGAVSTIKSVGPAPNSPGLPCGLSSLNPHHYGMALAPLQPSPRILDFYSITPSSPTVTKSRLESYTQNNFLGTSTVSADPTPPDASRFTKDETPSSANPSAQPVRFEFPPVVIEGLPVQQGLPGFASFNFGNVHSVTYRSTCQRLPTPYPLREDLDWLELQDEAEFYALSKQEDPDSDSSSPSPGIRNGSSPPFLMSGFPSALCLSKDDAVHVVQKFPSVQLQRRSLPHSKSLSALGTMANDFITSTTSSLSSSRPSARPMLLSALSSALSRRERSRRIRFDLLPFAVHLNDDTSWRSSQHCTPTPFPSPRAGRVLDPDLMFDSAS